MTTVALLASTVSVAAAHAASASVSAPQRLQLAFPLKVDGAGLDRFALTVSTPGSPLYRRYEPIPVLAQRFGASAAARGRVVDFLRAHAARDVRIDATGLFAAATMDARVARRLFGAPSARLRAADGFASVAPATPARVPTALKGVVEGVVGLDMRSAAPRNVGSFTRAVTTAAAQPTSELPHSGTASGCSAAVQTGAFTPNQYLTAYGFPTLTNAGARGQGEHVALIETDGVKSSDVSSFAGCFGIPVPPIRTFRVGIARNLPSGREATVDAEVVDAAAPRLGSIDVYQTKPDLSSLLTALTAPLQRSGSKPDVISVSLGVCEPEVRAALGLAGLRASQLAIAAASASGTTIVAATGDTGSAGCLRANGAPKARLAITYPASSWFVTAVGGSNLLLDASNQIADEVVWNDTGVHLGAGGGGLSSIWTRPPYQNAVVASNSRAVPDVSMLADVAPGYAIYCTTSGCSHANGPWISAGGTSVAAPLLAGGIALVDQVLVVEHQETLGALNPFFYSAGGLTFRPIFNDITRIGNDIGPYAPGGTGSPLGCCTAKPGYDDASGWGSVSMPALVYWAHALQPHSLGSIGEAVLPHQHPVTAGKLAIRLFCSLACYLVGDIVVRIDRSKPFEAYSGLFHLRRPGSKTIQLKFPGNDLQRLRSALAHHKRIVAVVYGVLANANGQFLKYSAPNELRLTG